MMVMASGAKVFHLHCRKLHVLEGYGDKGLPPLSNHVCIVQISMIITYGKGYWN